MNLRAKAYESFTRQLLAKNIRPGQFVTQRELVALTGMTLGAVRELIPRLEAEGLIVTVPQRGMQIAAVDVKLVRNAFQLRAAIEKEAVARFVETASDAEVAALDDALQTLLRDGKRGTSEALLERAQAVDWGFHDAIVDALGNELISRIYRVNSIRIRLIRLDRVTVQADILWRVLAEHSAVMAAIKRRDVAGAVAALERHLATARNRALGLEALPGGMARAAPVPSLVRRRRR